MNQPTGHIGLWIQAEILFSDLRPVEKLVLAEIVALSRNSHQFMKTNNALAKGNNVSLRTINRAIAELVKRKLIECRIIGFSYNGAKKRVIIPNFKVVSKLRKVAT